MSAADVLTVRLALCSNGYTPLPLFGDEVTAIILDDNGGRS